MSRASRFRWLLVAAVLAAYAPLAIGGAGLHVFLCDAATCSHASGCGQAEHACHDEHEEHGERPAVDAGGSQHDPETCPVCQLAAQVQLPLELTTVGLPLASLPHVAVPSCDLEVPRLSPPYSSRAPPLCS